MKYRLPEGTAGLSHGGKAVALAADGTLELGADALVDLAPHGIEPATEVPPAREPVRRPPTKPQR